MWACVPPVRSERVGVGKGRTDLDVGGVGAKLAGLTNKFISRRQRRRERYSRFDWT